MTHRTSGGETDAIGKAAVGFDEGEQALAALRKLHKQQLRSIHAHPYSQHLAWTEMLVQSSCSCQQGFQSGIRGRFHHGKPGKPASIISAVSKSSPSMVMVLATNQPASSDVAPTSTLSPGMSTTLDICCLSKPKTLVSASTCQHFFKPGECVGFVPTHTMVVANDA